MPYTTGFGSAGQLNQHFSDHGGEFDASFGMTTELDYLACADRFIGGPKKKGTIDCRRRCRDGSLGDYIRFNTITEEYCVMSNTKVIRTYFIPDPAVHKQATNLAYFQAECRKVLC